MFCPICKAEYRHGVIRCSDCDVSLVDQLPKLGCDSDGELPNPKLKAVWSGEDQSDCVAICEKLRDAEIPYKVFQDARQFLKGVDEHYEIGVPPQFCKQAENIIESGQVDFTDEPSDQAIMELPAQDALADAAEGEIDPNSGKWEPGSATVEIWSQPGAERSLMIESSLRENYINFRAEDCDNGLRRIFVMPKYELRSREIVREIENGTPPK